MNQYNRKSVRLKGYDYTSIGRYFVTIVTRNRLRLFGKIVDGEMMLNKFGKIAAREWENTMELRDNVSLGANMIMPDHVHFLVHIDQQQEQKQYTPEELEKRAGAVAGKHMNKPGSLGAIVRGYKGAVTRQVLEAIKSEMDVPDLKSLEFIRICDALANEKTIWVNNYNEAIIKTEKHYDNVTKYINDNPRKWDEQLRATLKL